MDYKPKFAVLKKLRKRFGVIGIPIEEIEKMYQRQIREDQRQIREYQGSRYSFGNLLRRCRKGLTQKELVEKLNISEEDIFKKDDDTELGKILRKSRLRLGDAMGAINYIKKNLKISKEEIEEFYAKLQKEPSFGGSIKKYRKYKLKYGY